MADTVLQAVGSQSAANQSLVPCSLGWCIQLYLCGVSTDRARRLLCHRKYQETRTSGVPGTRWFILAATLLNLIYSITIIWDLISWQVTQDRSDTGLNQLKIVDAVSGFLGGLVGIIVPAFMAIRCWRILSKSWIFAAIICGQVLLALGAVCWVFVATFRYALKLTTDETIFLPTLVWLWAIATTDLTITICLAVHLRKLKRGFNASTDNLLDSLVRLSFETSAPPALAAMTAAIIYACTWQTDYGWNIYFAIVPFLPSLYLLSLVYCLLGTRARGKAAVKPAPHTEGAAGGQGMTGIHRVISPATTTWEAPTNWGSSMVSGPGELESFQPLRRGSVPFANYIPTLQFEGGSKHIEEKERPNSRPFTVHVATHEDVSIDDESNSVQSQKEVEGRPISDV